jgi:outer membrane protein OmpA-like peptidoglycan-associated protein
MRQVKGIALVLPAVLLTASGCVATRDWVRETVGQRAAEIDQRISTVDGERRQDAVRIDQQGQRLDGVEVSVRENVQRVEGMGFRVQGLETAVGQATDLAKGAHARADEVDARLTRLWDKRHQRDLVESVNVQFAFNRWDLDDSAQTALVALVRDLQQNPKLTVDLEGYADPKGAREYNVQLSQRRVEAVRRYLVEKGVALPRIQSIGLGSIADPKVPDASKRRVTVKLMVLPE